MGTEDNQTNVETEVNVPQKDVLLPENEGESLDLLFRALDTQDGRLACYYLSQRDTSMSVTDLASLVAASTHETELRALTTEDVARTRAALTTTHLPKLEAAGLITWEGPMVRLTDESTPAQDWLTAAFDREIE